MEDRREHAAPPERLDTGSVVPSARCPEARSRTWLLVMAAAVIIFAMTSLAPAGDGEPADHPDVNPATTCVDCHQRMTPEVVDEWYASAHGINSVKCFMCHGSTGDDFTLDPEPARCVTCHAEEVATMTPSNGTQTPDQKAAAGASSQGCFSCHPSHLLSPHRSAGSSGPDGSEQAGGTS